MSLQSKIAILKQKADKYDKIQNDYISLQENYKILEDNYKTSCQYFYNSFNERNNIINDLNEKLVDKNNEYTNNYTSYYNFHFTNEYNKLQNVINEQKKQIEQLNYTVSYYTNYLNFNNTNVVNVTDNYIYKEQILNTKINNLLKELSETETEKEYLLDKISYLTGEIDDFKGNSEIKQKNYEIDLLQKEVNKLEDYILDKDRIISNLVTSSPNQYIITLKNSLQQKYIENITLKQENETYKKIIEELEGMDITDENNDIEDVKIEEYENKEGYLTQEEDEDDDQEEEEEEEEEAEEDDQEEDNEIRYNIFNEWVKINKPKEEIMKYLTTFKNLEQIVIH